MFIADATDMDTPRPVALIMAYTELYTCSLGVHISAEIS